MLNGLNSTNRSTDFQTTRSLLLTTLLLEVESNGTRGLKEKIQTFTFKTKKRDNGGFSLFSNCAFSSDMYFEH